MKVIVDRIENAYLVCEKEDKTMMDVPMQEISGGAKPGDVLRITKAGIVIDQKATDERRKEIQKLTNGLWDE
jgi:Protein of unknown function (DUF3006).